jgi:tRNA modification GTPase
LIWNKIDLASGLSPRDGVAVSAKTGQGIRELESAIVNTALARAGAADRVDGPTITHARHLHALEEAGTCITRASDVLAAGEPLDFLAIEVQAALTALGRITGETAPQDIVNEIFHRFCIGK